MQLSQCMMLLTSLCIIPCATASLGRASDSSRITPVQKVIQMLNGMETKGKEEKHKEEVAFAAFAEFCSITRTQKGRMITAASDKIVELEATITKAEADADRLGQEIAGLDKDVAGWSAEASEAKTVRKKELATFEATHEDYSESIDALERALQALKRASADRAQAPAKAESLVQLQRVVQLPRVPVDVKKVLTSALQLGSTSEEMAAPEANAYEFQSSGVVEMLEKLRQRFIDERRVLIKQEMNRKHAFEGVMQSLADETAYAEASKGKKAAARAGQLEDAATGKGDLAETRESKNKDEKYLRDLTTQCSVKSKEYESRQKLRAAEIEAIQKAIEIISSPEVSGAADKHLPSALLEVRSSQQGALVQLLSAGEEGAPPAQRRAAALLAEQAKRSNSGFLESVASRLKQDPFLKVKKMIKDLLVRLMEEANEEADHKGWCDTELATNKQSRESLASEAETLTARVDELTARGAKLTQEISDLSDEIAASDTAVAKATADRKEEKETNAATVSEAKQAQLAVQQALKVLKEFYGQAGEATALVQQKQAPTEPATWDKAYTGMQGSSTGIVGMLEVISSDFARLEAETSSSEDEAQREHEAFLADSETARAVKDKEMRHKGFDKDRTQRALNSAKKELRGTQEELTSALEYYDKLKPSCVNSGVTYGDRVAKRKAEIESLQQALKILEGEDLTGPAA